MSRFGRAFVIALTALGFLTSVRASFAVLLADTTVVTFGKIAIDTKEEFKVTGTMSIERRSDPALIVLPTGVDSIRGDNWVFYIAPLYKDWKVPPAPPGTSTGAHEYYIGIAGTHIHGPHEPPGPPVDKDPHDLGLETTKKTDIKFGSMVPVTGSFRIEHPLLVGTKPHWDVWGVRQNVTAMKGPNKTVSGPFGIGAKHTDDKTVKSIPVAVVMGSSSGNGTYISYDAGNGTLTIHTGALNILNSTGSLTPGIEASFAGDPILNATLPDMVMQFMGPTGDGGYRFGGAHTSLNDPELELSLAGDFSEYIVRNTSLMGTIDSYAVYDSLWFSDTGRCDSEFLKRFADVNVMGEDIPSSEWLQWQGLGLEFVTTANLAGLTAGFTVSAFNVPATVAISGSKRFDDALAVPEELSGAVVGPSRSHPNPFSDRSTLRYRVTEPAPVRIDVFDPSGRLVRRLVDLASQVPGEYAATWDGTNGDGKKAAAGVYYYRISLGTRTWSNEVVLVR